MPTIVDKVAEADDVKLALEAEVVHLSIDG